MRFPVIVWGLFLAICAYAGTPGYVGADTCAGCHKGIASQQSKSNMRLTWQPAHSSVLAPAYSKQFREGDVPALDYAVRSEGEKIIYRVKVPGDEQLTLPVEKVVGGQRHGLSFLVRLKELGGLPLERAPLIETRYLHSAHVQGLALSPGFPEERPGSYETAIGRVLSPSFEKKCLGCHGEPADSPKAQAGVHCESCHGPGSAHLTAVAKGTPKQGIVIARRDTAPQQLEQCAQCHAGFSKLSDPMPQDLLISNQVNAMKNSECYIQSNAGFSCTSCHDPHTNSATADTASVQTCLSCHSTQAKKAASCPVSAKGNCVQCHMPSEQRGAFTLTDHWIRVPLGKSAPAGAVHARSSIRPRRAFLRLLAAEDRAKAGRLREQLLKGAPFFDVARENSVDPSATSGGYLGEMWLDQMDPTLADAVAHLQPGELSAVVEKGGKFLLLERQPRDFRWQAYAIEQEATALRAKGQWDQAIEKYTAALRTYPRFLRALVFLGVSLGQKGEVPRAAAVLQHAANLYPEDPAALYNLGIALGTLGKNQEEIGAYQKALLLEPDLIPAYLNLGAAYQAAGALDRAAETYRQGLQVNPLSGALYYSLAQVRQQQNQPDEAQRLRSLAGRIDRKLK